MGLFGPFPSKSSFGAKIITSRKEIGNYVLLGTLAPILGKEFILDSPISCNIDIPDKTYCHSDY